VEIQPQLVMLQKTLLNIEGLGRQLDPELDLWKTAKPFLERWMKEQIGLRGFLKGIVREAPRWATMVPKWPRLVDQALEETPPSSFEAQLEQLIATQEKQNRWLKVVAGILAVVAVISAWQLIGG
jgi:ubiquinone biosynthesis protein